MSTKNRLYSLLALLIVFSFLVGCAGQPTPTAAPVTVAEPTEAPAAEPTEAPAVAPTEAPAAEPTEAPAPEPTEAPSDEITRENTFIIAVDGDLEGWDPGVSTYFAVNDMIQAVYDTLVVSAIKTDDKGRAVQDLANFEPRLAKDWEVSEDGTLWTFHLREDAVFHSGNPVTSKDVKYSFDRAIKLEKGIMLTLLNAMGVTSVDQLIADEPYVFQIKLEEPNNLVLPVLSIVANSVVLDSELVEANISADDPLAENWLRSNTAGSGPYVLEEYVPGDRAVYTAFADYWGDKPAMKQIIYKTIPSAQDRVLLLMNGDVDMSYNVPGQDVTTTLKGVDGVSIESFSAPSTTVFFVNNTQPPFTDVRVRKALCNAVPYDALIDNVLYGLGTKAPGPVAPSVAYSMDVNDCEYDLDKAKALLKDAGFENGLDMVVTYREGRPEEEATAIFLQGEFAKINVRVELEKIQSAAWNERRSAKTIMAGLDGYTPYAPTPIYVMNFWYMTGAVLNTWLYSNARVDELAVLGRTAMDDAQIKEYMTEMQTIVGEDQPVVWLFNPFWNVVMRSDIQGYVFYADRFTRHYMLSRK